MSDSQAIVSRPWGGLASYTDLEWWEIWQSLFDGTQNRGPLLGYLNELEVSASSPAAMTVSIGTGAGIIMGVWFKNDTARTLTVAANGGGANRYDLVFAHWTRTTQQVQLRIVDGTAATCAAAVAPAANAIATYQSGVTEWAIPLACITVTPGATSIASGNITDLREFCRFRMDPGSLPDLSTINVNPNTRQMYVYNVGVTQISSAIAGDGLVGGSGAALDVNPDGVTLEIVADVLRIAGGAVSASIRANRTRSFYVSASKLRKSSGADASIVWGSGAGWPDGAEGWVVPYNTGSLVGHTQVPVDFASGLGMKFIFAHEYGGVGTQPVVWRASFAADAGGDLMGGCDEDIQSQTFLPQVSTDITSATAGYRICSDAGTSSLETVVAGDFLDFRIYRPTSGLVLDLLLLGVLFEYTADM